MNTVRTCGSCTACCKTHPVREIGKSAHQWCTHCAIGKGCLIYPKRPRGCVDFQCVWLYGMMPDDEKPDRIKVVVDVIEYEFGVHVLPVFVLWEVSPGAFEKKRIEVVRERILNGGHSLLEIPCGGECLLRLQPAHALFATEYVLEDGRKPRIIYL